MGTFEDLFETDDELATNGVPIDYGENSKGGKIVFWVAEAGNPNHEKQQRRRAKALDRARGKPDVQRKLTCEIVADSILPKWAGVLDANEKEIEPTRDNKIMYLFKYKKFFLDVMEAAMDMRNFRASAEDDMGEDSVPTSAGTSKTEKVSTGSKV